MASRKKPRGERPADRTRAMNEYMAHLTHPLKAEIAAVRAIILQASSKIHERVKWDAPSFYYKEDLATFDLRSTKQLHLIVRFPEGTTPPKAGGLVGVDHENRHEVTFRNLAEVAARKPALTQLVRDWVESMDKPTVIRD